MLAVLADLLTIGIAIAISPLAIVAVILMASAGKGRTNGTAFIVGCYAFAVVLLGTLVFLGRGAGADEEGSGTNITLDVIEIVLGCALLAMAVLQWRKRSSKSTPKWMDSIDRLNIWQALLLGVLISGPLSPKDLPLLIASGGRISQAALSVEETVAVILIFGAIGIIGAGIPWLISVIAPNSAERRLAGLRTWLVSNHAVIMTVLFIILGFKLIGSGVADLAT